MLFDTLRRKNQAEQEEREWNANRPADYVSRNKDAMDSLTGQIGSGFDWDTGSKAYQQYRAQAQANAAASAENAQANAAMLAGGYGSSYADSVAKQGQQQALSGIDNAVPGLRGQALSEYQNQQNDLLSALSGMANTEALDRSAYGSNFANYTAWQNFLANQSEQARNENDNYWNNLWNTVKNIGSAALTAYDGYKGYTQQQWENDFAREQWEYNKNRTDQSDALNAYQQAFNLYTQGAGDAASDVLNRYGLNANAFANYTGAPVTRDDQAGVLSTAASLVASGNQEAAANLLKMYGMDTNAAGDYNTLTQRALSAALAKRAATGSGGSRGYYRQSSEWSKSELRNLMKDRESVAAKGGDTTWYDGILADAGYPVPETKNTESTGKSTAQSSDTGTLLAQRYAKRGYSAWAITNIMSQNGYSDKEISDALEKAGVE
jgi:lyzozyme M1 (1,4-beta-N-acetylmuramidase)|nr:MAG TPA: hypothetical protein [Caudoviricetes sp.]